MNGKEETMEIEEMRAQVAAHDASVATEVRNAVAELTQSKAYREVRGKLAEIGGKGARAPFDGVLASLATSFDLLERMGQ